MMNWLAFQLPRMMSLDSPSGNDESVSVSVAKKMSLDFHWKGKWNRHNRANKRK
jgi:hypothetical protein